jgi:Domain of unknown function (DUF4265)
MQSLTACSERPGATSVTRYAARMTTPNDVSDLTRVIVGFNYHWADIDAETFWAKPLGGDRYELRNVPFYAYGLNFGDVVVATKEADDEFPVIERVDQSGGHRTFRVQPLETAEPERLAAVIESIAAMGVTVERATAALLALDCPPGVDGDAVFDRLDEFADEGVIEFETCEQQNDDNFGPSEDE